MHALSLVFNILLVVQLFHITRSFISLPQDAAECLLLSLLSHLNNWPPATGPNSLSAANKESDFADLKKRRLTQLSSYVFDQTIISLYRHPRDGNPRMQQSYYIAFFFQLTLSPLHSQFLDVILPQRGWSTRVALRSALRHARRSPQRAWQFLRHRERLAYCSCSVRPLLLLLIVIIMFVFEQGTSCAHFKSFQ